MSKLEAQCDICEEWGNIKEAHPFTDVWEFQDNDSSCHDGHVLTDCEEDTIRKDGEDAPLDWKGDY